jgi:hypothetical protein
MARVRSIMKFIAHELREVSQSQGIDKHPTAKEILEVYKLDMFLLADEVGLGNDVKLLDQHLNLLEEILGEDYVLRLERNQLIDLLKVITYLHTNYVEAAKILVEYYERSKNSQTSFTKD